MYHIRIVSDPAECGRIWRDVVPRDNIVDLWEVRECFHRHYRQRLHFVVVEKCGVVHGLLPLCQIVPDGKYFYFPGETWEGKTWLEQNRIIASNMTVMGMMIDYLTSSGIFYQLRYLLPQTSIAKYLAVDEIGYLFNPADYSYDMDRYFETFSHKSSKRIKREVASMETRGVEYRYNNLDDFEILISMNLLRYGSKSYFSDSRFANGFSDLVSLLASRGQARITTVIIDGVPAAVDIGSVYNGAYTLLAGSTNSNFPGVAKLINLHHMRWACEQQIRQVDFLCGEFSWKPMFHLSPRPLYTLSNIETMPIVVPEPVVNHSIPAPAASLYNHGSLHG